MERLADPGRRAPPLAALARCRAPRGSGDARPPGAARASKVALVCAGGGVTGAVYEIGCLRALDEILGPKLRELDLYVGISGGAFVASLLAAASRPREMYDEAILPSRGTLGAASADVFRWSGPELLRRIGQAPRVLTGALRTSLSATGHGWSDLAWSLFQLLPAGLLTTEGIREYLERVFRARLGADRFARLRARAERGGRRPRQRRGRRFRPQAPPRRADLDGGRRPRPRCPGSTARSASRGATTSTAACARPRTSTSRSSRAPSS